MKFYIDTANVDEIRSANDMGIIAGVTTNPSLIAKEGRDYAETLKEIAKAGEGIFVRASNSNVGLNTLLDEIDRMDKTLLEERVFSDYAEKYQYFLIMALIFVLLDFMVLGRKNKNFLKINIFGSETKSVGTNR